MPKKQPTLIHQPTGKELAKLQNNLSEIFKELLAVERMAQKGISDAKYSRLLDKLQEKMDKLFGLVAESQDFVGDVQARATALEARGNPRDRLVLALKERIALLQGWLEELEGQ